MLGSQGIAIGVRCDHSDKEPYDEDAQNKNDQEVGPTEGPLGFGLDGDKSPLMRIVVVEMVDWHENLSGLSKRTREVEGRKVGG